MSRYSPPPNRSSFSSTPRYTSAGGRVDRSTMFQTFRKRFKYPQLDFEVAIWEMTSLILAPKKVFRSIYYHKQSENTWSRKDPSFSVLLSLFLSLTAVGWGLAYTPSFAAILRLMCSLVFVHFLATSIALATAGYYLCGKFLKVPATAALGRAGIALGEGELEWMYCWEIAVRAFFPVWVFLYVVQFLMMPLLARDYWISVLLGNTLYLVAFSFYTVITFLGYNTLPFLQHTEILLVPVVVLVISWAISLLGFNVAKHVVPLCMF